MIWIKIKYKLSLFFRAFLFKLGLKKILLRNRYGERILVFHGVDSKGETRYNSRFVSANYFEEFIKYIVLNYNVISLEDYYQKNFKPNTLNIAITFDDGYLNNYQFAIPILKKYNVPASFYITTIYDKRSFLWPDFLDLISFYSQKKQIRFEGNNFLKNTKNEYVNGKGSLKNNCKKLSFDKIDSMFDLFKDEWAKIQKKQSLGEYWQLMNKEQIREVANDPLFTIGSHSFTHANLEEIPKEEARAEILKSKEILESICGFTIDEFAFPFGAYTTELISHCKSIGFNKILLVDYKNKKDKNDPILRNRFVINPYISMEHQLACLLKGSYH